MEPEQLLSELHNDFHLLKENAVQVGDVLLYVAAGLVDHGQQAHLVLDNGNDLVDVCAVVGNH